MDDCKLLLPILLPFPFTCKSIISFSSALPNEPVGDAAVAPPVVVV